MTYKHGKSDEGRQEGGWGGKCEGSETLDKKVRKGGTRVKKIEGIHLLLYAINRKTETE